MADTGLSAKQSADPLLQSDAGLRQAMELLFFAYRDFTGEADALLAGEDIQAVPAELRGILASVRDITENEEVQALPERANALLSRLQETAASLNRVMTELEAQDVVTQITAAVDDVAQAADGLPELVNQARGILDQAGEARIDELADSATELLNAAGDVLDQDSTRALPGELNAALASLRAALEELENGGLVANANATLASARDAANAIADATSVLPQLARDLRRVADQANTTLADFAEDSRFSRETRAAIEDYGMVRPGARWLVGISGGKDSYSLLALLHDLKWRGLLPVDLLACNLDQGQPNFPKHILPEWLDRFGIEHRIEYRDTYSIVTDKLPETATYCSLCSRLRRGNLYRIAREEGCSAVVLGHHRDDILETFFMNLFHGGRLATMPPKLVNEEGDLFVYRPLAHVAEADCEKFARAMNYPIIPCDLCGSQDGLQRMQVKAILDQWEKNSPGRRQVMFKALTNIRPSHMLDPKLFDFARLMRDPERERSDIPDLR